MTGIENLPGAVSEISQQAGGIGAKNQQAEGEVSGETKREQGSERCWNSWLEARSPRVDVTRTRRRRRIKGRRREQDGAKGPNVRVCGKEDEKEKRKRGRRRKKGIRKGALCQEARRRKEGKVKGKNRVATVFEPSTVRDSFQKFKIVSIVASIF